MAEEKYPGRRSGGGVGRGGGKGGGGEKQSGVVGGGRGEESWSQSSLIVSLRRFAILIQR